MRTEQQKQNLAVPARSSGTYTRAMELVHAMRTERQQQHLNPRLQAAETISTSTTAVFFIIFICLLLLFLTYVILDLV